MQSIRGDDGGTYAWHMVPLTAGMLGLPCLLCLGPWQPIPGDYFFVVANLGVRCCHNCISGYAPPFLMQIFALDLSGNCPGWAKSCFTASESQHSTPNYYPLSHYLQIHSLGGRLKIYIHKNIKNNIIMCSVIVGLPLYYVHTRTCGTPPPRQASTAFLAKRKTSTFIFGRNTPV
jgi:hypothetical protein